MLLGIAIALIVIGIVLLVLIGAANMMADGGTPASAWPALAILGAAVLVLVLRHFVHGMPLTW